MSLRMGPILSFRGATKTDWRVSVLVVTDETDRPVLVWGPQGGQKSQVEPMRLYTAEKKTVWRFDIKALRAAEAIAVSYSISDYGAWKFCVPAFETPLKIAYASCNGFSDPKDMKRVADKNALWKNMGEKHAAEPYHLLFMGGDQVYGDALWQTVQVFKDWAESPVEKRVKTKFRAEMKGEAWGFYFKLYIDRWSQSEPGAMFAQVPTVMMWDDHDIFDGWGSYPAQIQDCDVYRGLFEAARFFFSIFQRQDIPDTSKLADLLPEKGFSLAYRIPQSAGDIAVLAVDMRSERTSERVVGDETWSAVYNWIDKLNDEELEPNNKRSCKHLFVMSSIPVVHPSFTWVESLLNFLPGQQELEDDLKDHWHSRTHKAERRRLIHRLLACSREQDVRVTLLAGDVHVGAIGIIESVRDKDGKANSSVINHLTSSAIVHPPPPGILLFALETLGAHVENVDRGITSWVEKIPGTEQRFFRSRNWLSLEFDDKCRIWANWHIENEQQRDQQNIPYTKVIHPVQ